MSINSRQFDEPSRQRPRVSAASLRTLAAVATGFAMLGPAAQAQLAAPRIMMVNMGGNDCPPCIAWRVAELPKLQRMPEFQAITFVHATKSINASVPPTWALPDAVRPFKDKLDEASSGMHGSPQVALLVDGQVYDYYFGARSADEVLQMIRAINAGTPYPFPRCLKKQNRDICLVKAS